MRRYANI